MANDIPQCEVPFGKVSLKDTRSDWDDSLATIDSILNPTGEAFAALSSSQVAGLKRMKSMLLRPVHRREEVHIPRELLSISDPDDDVCQYLISNFGGVAKEKKSLKKLVKRTIMANTFIRTLSRKIKVKELPTFVPDEFLHMSKERQLTVYDRLSWENLCKWNFDVFELHDLTDGLPIVFVSWAIICSPHSQQAMAKICGKNEEEITGGFNFKKSFEFSSQNLITFLRFVEKSYNSSNAYHNNCHAADVLQTLNCLFQFGVSKPSSHLKIFAMLLAAACHDLDHPGFNNSFQVNARSKLAILYNDKSVLENMHASKVFEKLIGEDRDPKIDIFAGLNKVQVNTIRHIMVEAILHTDMTKHFETVNVLKAMSLRHEDKDKILELDDADETTLFFYLLHAADISNPSKPSPLCVEWADRCLEEFFAQGDIEKARGLPVSPLCDRETTFRPQSQIGFIKFVILPTFKVLAEFLPQVDEQILPLINENLSFWENEKKLEDEKIPNPIEQAS